MREAKLGELRARITGGKDGNGAGAGPVVVLLHGFGAPGDDLVPLWRTIPFDPPRTLRYVFPEGPLDLRPALGRGRAWWWIDVEARVRRHAQGQAAWDATEVPEGLIAARSLVTSLLDAVEASLQPESGKVVLGGFSQGGMLALDVALAQSERLSAVGVLSGTHMASETWSEHLRRPGGVRARTGVPLPVFMSHGLADPLLPFTTAEALKSELEDAGLPVEWRPFGGGHGIPPEVVVDLGRFLSKTLA